MLKKDIQHIDKEIFPTHVDVFPKVDISETKKAVKVTAEIQGIDPEDIEIDVHDTWMTIGGIVDREKLSANRYEEMHGQFRQKLTFPSRVIESKMKASHRNGVYSITLPKAE